VPAIDVLSLPPAILIHLQHFTVLGPTQISQTLLNFKEKCSFFF
jgi:hypothetical protein